MKEPARTLIGEIERVVSALPDAVLFHGVAADGLARFQSVMGMAPPPGLAAFLAAHDGGLLGPETRLLTMDEAVARVSGARRTPGISHWPAGLWPIVDRAGRRYALDAEEASGDGEWPVVEVTEQGVDRVGTSCLRFLHVLCAELASVGMPGESAISLCEARCHRDPGLADHWLDFAELLEPEGRAAEIDATLAAALRAATPPTPALMLAIGMRAVRVGDHEGRCGPTATRSRTSRSARATTTRGSTRRRWSRCWRPSAATRRRSPRRGPSLARRRWPRPRSGAAKRGCTGRPLRGPSRPRGADKESGKISGKSFTGPSSNVGALAVRIVAALDPLDRDLAKAAGADAGAAGGAGPVAGGAQELEAGRAAQARAMRGRSPLCRRWSIWAPRRPSLAEALNAVRALDAAAVAKRAIELNPALVDGWRELGDAELEAGHLKEGEAAFRQVWRWTPPTGSATPSSPRCCSSRGGRWRRWRRSGEAGSRGGDPFFIAAIRGDIYAEMERHTDAADAYDLALAFEPDDHWALHEAALEHGFAGNTSRASELFQAALQHDREGCHQTLVDYGDRLRRLGRIGDAVEIYRKAVAAVPGDP